MNTFLKKTIIFAVLVLLLFVGGFIIYRSWVFGEGVKAGELNQVVYKGIIFKTYEGKLIQSGFKSENQNLHSNEFEFSVVDDNVAQTLMRAGNMEVELHYKEYLGILPWRGYSRYVVDSIVNIKDKATGESIKLPVEAETR